MNADLIYPLTQEACAGVINTGSWAYSWHWNKDKYNSLTWKKQALNDDVNALDSTTKELEMLAKQVADLVVIIPMLTAEIKELEEEEL